MFRASGVQLHQRSRASSSSLLIREGSKGISDKTPGRMGDWSSEAESDPNMRPSAAIYDGMLSEMDGERHGTQCTTNGGEARA